MHAPFPKRWRALPVPGASLIGCIHPRSVLLFRLAADLAMRPPGWLYVRRAGCASSGPGQEDAVVALLAIRRLDSRRPVLHFSPQGSFIDR